MLKVIRTTCTPLSIAAISAAAIGCGDAVSSGSLNMQMELRFFDTTLDSGYVLLAAEATGGAGGVVSLVCTGIVQTSGNSPRRDSTFVARGTTDREVSETCNASAGEFFAEGTAVTVIPAVPIPPGGTETGPTPTPTATLPAHTMPQGDALGPPDSGEPNYRPMV